MEDVGEAFGCSEEVAGAGGFAAGIIAAVGEEEGDVGEGSEEDEEENGNGEEDGGEVLPLVKGEEVAGVPVGQLDGLVGGGNSEQVAEVEGRDS